MRAFDAHYRIVPSAFKSERYVDAYGETRLAIIETCADWQYRSRTAVTLVRPGSVEEESLSRSVFIEPKARREPVRFAVRHIAFGAAPETIAGRIRRDGARPLLVTEGGAAPTSDLPRGVSQPLSLWRDMVNALGAEPTVVNLHLFDPLRAAEAQPVSVTVGPARDLVEPLVAHVIKDVERSLRAARDQRPHAATALPPGDIWPVDILVGDDASPTSMPVHALGAPLAILTEMEDVSLQADLVALTVPPAPLCDGSEIWR